MKKYKGDEHYIYEHKCDNTTDKKGRKILFLYIKKQLRHQTQKIIYISDEGWVITEYKIYILIKRLEFIMTEMLRGSLSP